MLSRVHVVLTSLPLLTDVPHTLVLRHEKLKTNENITTSVEIIVRFGRLLIAEFVFPDGELEAVVC